ncbi:MAG: hypothetical protein ACR2RL_11705, partial [Gammaproteobacteria bacterium]
MRLNVSEQSLGMFWPALASDDIDAPDGRLTVSFFGSGRLKSIQRGALNASRRASGTGMSTGTAISSVYIVL